MAHLDLDHFDPNALATQRSERARTQSHTQQMLIVTALASLSIVVAAALFMSLLA